MPRQSTVEGVMTVQELIERLASMPRDAVVCVSGYEFGVTEDVEITLGEILVDAYKGCNYAGEHHDLTNDGPKAYSDVAESEMPSKQALLIRRLG